MSAKSDGQNMAAALARGVPKPPPGPTRGGVVTKTTAVTVEMLPAEYDKLGGFCRRARRESGASRDVAKGHLLRVLFLLAESDPVISERLFERLLTEGPTRHRT